jgi:hypothetical protein
VIPITSTSRVIEGLPCKITLSPRKFVRRSVSLPPANVSRRRYSSLSTQSVVMSVEQRRAGVAATGTTPVIAAVTCPLPVLAGVGGCVGEGDGVGMATVGRADVGPIREGLEHTR